MGARAVRVRGSLLRSRSGLYWEATPCPAPASRGPGTCVWPRVASPGVVSLRAPGDLPLLLHLVSRPAGCGWPGVGHTIRAVRAEREGTSGLRRHQRCVDGWPSVTAACEAQRPFLSAHASPLRQPGGRWVPRCSVQEVAGGRAGPGLPTRQEAAGSRRRRSSCALETREFASEPEPFCGEDRAPGTLELQVVRAQ